MSSSSSQNPPWPPYQTYRDCSQGICSIYCPQWCYIMFPPPPPPRRRFPSAAVGGDGGSATDFSPLIIAVIGILASAFILITYYTIITKYCRRRGGSGGVGNPLDGDPNHNSGDTNWMPPSGPAGLDESAIKSIAVLNYRRGEGLVEGSDCSVCLSEFQEEEKLRLLPKCHHAFHVPCIDAWLKSHATCPLCRANIHAAAAEAVVAEEIRESVAVPAQEIESGDVISEIAVVAEDLEAGGEESGGKIEIECGQSESEQLGISQMRRSSSLNFAAAAARAMKRSVSTGRFLLMPSGDGNSSNSVGRIPI
ncbi:unnamed protein product [Linum tenue]|uniref:RING-type E3 ubiquitin transferase n=1 Tax=Linum tenue TaxID=586396 RepID=A0AAV0HHK1_9ROSI|nr:unnamed protein product [Linum tenue]